MDVAVFHSLGFLLIVAGIVVIVTAIIFASRDTAKHGRVRGAGVIMLGPIPIIFGTDKKSLKTVLALALALTIIALIVVALNYWLLR